MCHNYLPNASQSHVICLIGACKKLNSKAAVPLWLDQDCCSPYMCVIVSWIDDVVFCILLHVLTTTESRVNIWLYLSPLVALAAVPSKVVVLLLIVAPIVCGVCFVLN